MQLDGPTVGAFLPVTTLGRGNKHWAGGKGPWIAFVRDGARWTLFNVYTKEEIEVPSVRDVEIYPDSPFRFHCDLMRLELKKIQIAVEPYNVGDGVWHYFLIAVFDKTIAIMRGGVDPHWRILSNDFVVPAKYVDAIQDLQQRIYAVTAPHGDVFVWDPLEWG